MSESFFLDQRGDFRSLKAYKKAECIYDVTYYFAHKYLEHGDRTIDQMVQAARSGKQNLAEGYVDAVSSKEMGIKLVNVNRASLQELLLDYEDFLRVRSLAQWPATRALSRLAAFAAHILTPPHTARQLQCALPRQ